MNKQKGQKYLFTLRQLSIPPPNRRNFRSLCLHFANFNHCDIALICD